MVEHISHNLSPMAAIAKYIKETDENAKIVFIGPCTAKKMEFQKESVRPYVDSVITFEELQALFDGCGVDITTLEEGILDNASYYGRIFARSGGLADADVYKRQLTILNDLQPEFIMLSMGLNDITTYSAENFAEKYKKFTDSIIAVSYTHLKTACGVEYERRRNYNRRRSRRSNGRCLLRRMGKENNYF